MINKRLSDLSCDEHEFKNAKPDYESALKDAGYNVSMRYENNAATNQRRNRKVIWFNPPFSNSVKTPIGRIFISLIKKHFPNHHKFHRIFNINTLKLSYSCMPNIENVIKQHNSKILNPKTQPQSLCNCRNRENCPLEGKCLTLCIVYRSTVTTQESTKNYYGTSESDFKTRFNNHTKSFNNRPYENDSELSKYVWSLKDKRMVYNIKWSIEKYCSPYKCGKRKCDLCISEKCVIVRSDPKVTLNHRKELLSKCRHRNKFSLKYFK